jgi:hypothetical protein
MDAVEADVEAVGDAVGLGAMPWLVEDLAAAPAAWLVASLVTTPSRNPLAMSVLAAARARPMTVVPLRTATVVRRTGWTGVVCGGGSYAGGRAARCLSGDARATTTATTTTTVAAAAMMAPPPPLSARASCAARPGRRGRVGLPARPLCRARERPRYPGQS